MNWLVTVTKDGKETEELTKEGAMIVRNPSGEEYVLSAHTFWQRYQIVDIENERNSYNLYK